jgi:hypothetical protein
MAYTLSDLCMNMIAINNDIEVIDFNLKKNESV